MSVEATIKYLNAFGFNARETPLPMIAGALPAWGSGIDLLVVPHELIERTNRLRLFLAALKLPTGSAGFGPVSIVATYDPHDAQAFIHLGGLDDELLAAARRSDRPEVRRIITARGWVVLDNDVVNGFVSPARPLVRPIVVG